MRNNTDALRSLKKYVASSLELVCPVPDGRHWEVRLTDEKGAFRRPFCRVEEAGPPTYSGSSVVRTVTQSYQMLAHPVESDSPDEARFEAGRVQEAFYQAFAVGTLASAYRFGGGVGSTQFGRGHPFRVPLYNYDGKGPADGATEADRDPRDFMRLVEDPTAEAMRDDVDEMLWVVVCSIRMSWSRSAAVTSAGMPVVSVPMEATP